MNIQSITLILSIVRVAMEIAAHELEQRLMPLMI
jgi:hypothetical protein